MKELLKLREELVTLWPDGSSRNQCYSTCLMVIKFFGGQAMRGIIPPKPWWNIPSEEIHYWNRLPDGTEIDLTSDQYGGDGFNPVIKGKVRTNPNFGNKKWLDLWQRYTDKFI